MEFNIFRDNSYFKLKRFSSFLLGCAIIFLILKTHSSVRDYNQYLDHRIEVLDLQQKNKRTETIIDNGFLIKSTKSIFVIKAKSYSQYFILDFIPNHNNNFSFFFLINYLIVSIIIFFAVQKSTKQKTFTPQLLKGLEYLRIYIVIIFLLKILQIFFIRNYIENLSLNKISVSENFNFNGFEFQMILIVAAILISFVKEGVKLQIQQDLTI
jgi:hypothetical protein